MKKENHDSARLHPIKVVAHRTGLTPDVLRAWERRYEAITPSRSAGSRRLYSDEDIQRLRLLRKATLAGRSIGQIAGLTTSELEDLVASDDQAAVPATVVVLPAPRSSAYPPPARTAGHLESCLAAVGKLDMTALQQAIAQASVALGRAGLVEDVLLPLMREVGSAWRDGRMRIAQEHMTTSVVRAELAHLVSARDVQDSAPGLVSATPAGQFHELGALVAAATGAAEGWRVTYLGPDLPAEEIAAAALQRRARAVALSIVHPADDPLLAGELRRLRRLVPAEVALLAGGAAAGGYAGALGEAGALVCADMKSMREALERLRGAQ